MASSGKKRTTMAKLNRESKMREKRMEKEARKAIRKREAAEREDIPLEQQVWDEDTAPAAPQAVRV